MKNNPSKQRSSTPHNQESLATEAKEAVQQVSERVKETASEAVSEVQHQASSAVRQQQDLIADKLDCVCEAFHDSAQRLRNEDAAPFASLIDQAAGQVEKLSTFLRERELKDVFGSVQSLARQHPVAFFGGCFVAGLMISRVIKSSTASASETMQKYELPRNASSSGSRSGKTSPSASRMSGRSGLERQSSLGQQYGSSTFTPAGSSSPGEGGTGSSSGSAARWEET